ncbi:MAG: hypothetical protein ACTSQQ_12270 [Candidatus Helarchaeota archaeon]
MQRRYGFGMPFLIMLFISLCIFSPNNQFSPRMTVEKLESPSSLKFSDAITLDQVPMHENLTYELLPIYDDRYFGTDIFNLTIIKSGGAALDIIVPIGQFLNTTKEGLQNMTIAKQGIINMSGGIDIISIKLTVYCITIKEDVPKRSDFDNYTISAKSADADLTQLLNYINTSSLFNFHYSQLAVWAVTDGPDQIPSGYIYNNTEVAWANMLLAAAGLSLQIPDMPIISSFQISFVLFSLGLIFFIYSITKRRQKLD